MRYFLSSLLLTFLFCNLSIAVDVQYVDLGLTSKTLWATCNLGASSPEEYGDFYAWGETKAKSTFSWTNYTHCNGTQASVKNLGSSIVSTSYDAAMAVLGSDWCLPTADQFEELGRECTFTKEKVNGVVCLRATGPNGKSIVIPMAGYKYGSTHSYKEQGGYLWSGNNDASYNYKATVMYLVGSTQKANISTLLRRTGTPIRAVRKTTATPSVNPPSNPSETETTGSYVDLGLTSKTLWATCNLGASSPEEYGDFYAWGETKAKSSFSWTNYTHCNGTQASVKNLGSSIVSTSYDAALAALGSDWCLPTADQFEELGRECTFTKEKVNGVVCLRATGPNGKSIVIPLAGYKYGSTHSYKEQGGYLWSGNNDASYNYKATVMYLVGSTQKANISTLLRRTGTPIRAVRTSSSQSEPDDSTDPAVPDVPDPEVDIPSDFCVDLGLTSKTLWATCNLGASSPEEYGDFYAWGETKAKSTFSWSNYTHCNGTQSSVKNLGSSIVSTSYDAAKAVLGSEWCLPTADQFEELARECTFTKETINGVVCMRVKGPNGNSIVMPLAGYKYDSTHNYNKTKGYYWSGDIDASLQTKAQVLCLTGSTQTADILVLFRRTGTPVRPVWKGNGSSEEGDQQGESGQPEEEIQPEDPTPVVPGSRPGPIIVDPYFANKGGFDVDGIDEFQQTTPTNTDIYTLSGVKVDDGQLRPGIYVRNGKKFVIR